MVAAPQQAEAPEMIRLFEISWEKDRATRLEPVEFTRLLREQVPVLEFVQWRVEEVGFGSAETVLPLNAAATNQHFTHQAALLALAADYTGGIALTSLLTGWPVLGVHPVTSRHSLSMWLLKMEIKFLRPSTADLTIRSRVPPALHDRIRTRFLDGRTVVETLTIEFCNGDVPVAEATATYFARQSDRLRVEGIASQQVNPLYQLKLASSADMIAGVRARETGKLFRDPYAARMAGQHGLAMADRFCERTPQLGNMVAARTRHLDDALRNFVHAGGRQIICTGVGWDMRAFRLDLPSGTRLFELDFPTTLAERRRRLAHHAIADPPGVERIEVPIDLRTMPLAATLADQVDADQPVFVIWEGMSMYFDEAEVHAILAGMRPLLQHPGSRLWLDVVARAPVETPELFPASIRDFMHGMRVLGEPFTFGTDDAASFLQSAGFRPFEISLSSRYLQDKTDPLYSIYRFCIATL